MNDQLMLISAAFFMGLGFPAFVLGLIEFNAIEILGGMALCFISLYLLVTRRKKEVSNEDQTSGRNTEES